MIERTFFALVLVACAAAAALTFAEPAKVAAAHAPAAPAAPVIELERVVITVQRDEGKRLAATAAEPTASRSLQ